MSPSLPKLGWPLLVALAVSVTYGAEPSRSVIEPTFIETPAPLDQEMKDLLQRRLAAARNAAEANIALCRTNKVTVDNVCASLERFTKAGIENVSSNSNCMCQAA